MPTATSDLAPLAPVERPGRTRLPRGFGLVIGAQFASALDSYRIAAQGRAPGAPAPTEAYQLSAINVQITDQMKALSDACPAQRKLTDLF